MKTIGIIAFALTLAITATSSAYWIWTPETGRWINPKYAVKDTPEEQIAYADEFASKGSTGDAIREYRKLLKYYPKAACVPQALYNLAKTYYAAGDDEKAFDTLQILVEKHPESSLVTDAVALQDEIARRLMSRRKPFVPRVLVDQDTRTQRLEKVIANDPYGPQTPSRVLHLAEYYLSHGKFDQAEELLTKMLRDTPDAPEIPRAAALLVTVRYRGISAVSTDPAAYQKVVAEADLFLAHYPTHPDAPAIRDIKQAAHLGAARALHTVASFYERTKGPAAAAPYWTRLAREYPDTTFGADAASKISAR